MWFATFSERDSIVKLCDQNCPKSQKMTEIVKLEKMHKVKRNLEFGKIDRKVSKSGQFSYVNLSIKMQSL